LLDHPPSVSHEKVTARRLAIIGRRAVYFSLSNEVDGNRPRDQSGVRIPYEQAAARIIPNSLTVRRGRVAKNLLAILEVVN
jgi:hypothetical protein